MGNSSSHGGGGINAGDMEILTSSVQCKCTSYTSIFSVVRLNRVKVLCQSEKRKDDTGNECKKCKWCKSSDRALGNNKSSFTIM
eukprot:8016656-Ditylum_brightwellii.AAC.1